MGFFGKNIRNLNVCEGSRPEGGEDCRRIPRLTTSNKLTDDELKGKTREFKDRLAEETLDDSFCRKPLRYAGKAAVSMQAFGIMNIPVQPRGGEWLFHRGRIAEMAKTERGEVNLGGNSGGIPECADRQGVHVVTVNDYPGKP